MYMNMAYNVVYSSVVYSVTMPMKRSPRQESGCHDNSLECSSARNPLLKARMSSTLANIRPLSSPNAAARGSLNT